MQHRITPVLVLLAVLAALLIAPASASPLAAPICFQQVPDCIDGRFAEFWQQNGALPVFGLPKSPATQQQVEGQTYLVQQFERNRFELHPENARPYDVLLGRLGDDLLKRQGRDWNTFPKVGGPPQPGCLFFAQTGHSICGAILRAYRASGLEFDGRRGKSEAESLALFGLPLSEPQVEDTPNGRFTVQWFERARFEIHPENQPPYDVLLGLLGNEVTAQPQPAPQPEPPPGQTPLPPSVNAAARPERGPRGTRFFFAARGFKPGEKIGVYITVPDQSVFGAPFQTTADENGVSDSVVSFQVPDDPEVPTGIWAITFEGVDSHNRAIAYFEVTDAAVPPQPQPPAPQPTPTLPPPSYNNCQADSNPGAAPNYPVRIVAIDKVAETVTLRNVTASDTIDLTGWKMCSITGNQQHPIGGTLAPGETRTFSGPNGSIWNNSSRDDGALYNPDGQLVSYWVD